MNLLPAAQLFEALLGQKPEEPVRYNWRDDPRARPSAAELTNPEIHAKEDAIRYIEFKQMFSQLRFERYGDRVDRYNDRKILLAILGVLLADATGVREIITAFLT